MPKKPKNPKIIRKWVLRQSAMRKSFRTSLGASPLLPQRVAYSYTDEDDGLWFHFRGIARETLLSVFHFLCPKNGNGAARTFRARYTHDAKYLRGHGYLRIEVHVFDRNDHFCSFDNFCILLESRFKTIAPKGSTITLMPMHDFLNITSIKKKKNINTKENNNKEQSQNE